jgi:hypothetical protein
MFVNLKNLEIMYNSQFTEVEPRICTTGAYLVPMQIFVNGEKYFIWVVEEFWDDTFNEDGNDCTPYVYSKDIDNMFVDEE